MNCYSICAIIIVYLQLVNVNCDLPRRTRIQKRDTVQEHVSLCQTPLYGSFRQTNAEYREIIVHGCQAAIVAYVFTNVTVDIFDGTFETGTKLNITALSPVQATGSLMSIRGNFSDYSQLVVSDRFWKDGSPCGGVFFLTPKRGSNNTFNQSVRGGCAYVFIGTITRFTLSPKVSFYMGYDLLDPKALMQSFPITPELNIFTAFLFPQTSVTLYMDDASDDESFEYCYSAACRNLEVSGVHPFCIPPIWLATYGFSFEVDNVASSISSLEVLNPISEKTDLTIYTPEGHFWSPDPRNFSCAINGSVFDLQFIGYDDRVGLYARISVAPSNSPTCLFVPTGASDPTSTPGTTPSSPTSEITSVTDVTTSTSPTDGQPTTPKSSNINSSSFLQQLIFLCLCYLCFYWDK